MILDIRNEGGLILTSNDPLNFTFGKASKTYNIAITNTPTNDRALGNLFNKNFEKTLIWDAVLEVQSLQMKGKIFITSWDKREAQAQFVTSAGTLWSDVAEKNLKEDYVWDELDHDLTLANVKTVALLDTNIMYDFIYRGTALLTEIRGRVMRDVDIAEMQPAIRVRKIIDKIFAGYTVTQNLFTTAQYNNLYLLYCQNQTRNSEGWAGERRLELTLDSDNDEVVKVLLDQADYFFEGLFEEDQLTDVFPEDPAGQYVYEITEDGAYAIKGRIRLDLAFVSIDAVTTDLIDVTNRKYILKVSEYTSADVFVRDLFSKEEAYPNYNATVTENLDMSFDTKTVELPAGNKIILTLKYESTPTYPSGNGEEQVTSITEVFSNLNAYPWQGFGAGGSVPGKWAVPDVTVAEFLSGIFKTFNAEFHVNVELKQVRIINREIAEPDLYNITDAILPDTIQIEETPVKENYQLGYTVDGRDDFAAEHFNVFRFSDGGKYVDNSARDTTEIISPYSFNAIRHRTPFIIQMTNGENPVYSTNFNARLAFYDGLVNFEHNLHAADDNNPVIDVNAQHKVFKNAITGIDLDYSTETNGLYDKYYKGNINRLTAGGVITCRMIIDSDFLTQIYYLSGKDLRANFIIQHDGFQGRYQLIELDQVKGDIFTAKLFRV